MINEITSPSEWENFILVQQPNTFLQSWEWGQTQVAEGNQVRYLGVWQADVLVATALVLTVQARRGTHYLIPHGPIMATAVDVKIVLQEIIEYMRSQTGSAAVALRIAPLLLDNERNRVIFRELGFKPAPMHVHAEQTWILDISRATPAILAGMRKTTRHAVQKAERDGVTTEIVPHDQILDRFWPLYETTRDRHGFTLYPRTLLAEQLHQFSAQNRVFGVVATCQGRDVAAAIIFQYGTTCFYYHGASITVPGVSPTQLLQFAAIAEAKRRGATTYNFWGIAPSDPLTKKPNPKHPFAGITIFKQGFGGQGINYLHAQDLPLSWRYRKLWIIESIRKIRRGF